VLRVCRVVVVALLVGMWCGPAGAESAEGQVERLAADAVNAYKGADYNRAVELLQRAYEIRQVPALLYNMAKAYDKLGDVEHAYDTYRRYADSADPDPKLKAKAESRLAVLEDVRRKKAATARSMEPRSEPRPAQVEPRSEPRPAEVEPARAAPPTAEQIRDKLRDERMRARKRDRYVALGLGVTAVACAGVAIGLSVNALSLQSQWSGQYGGDEAARRALRDDAQLRAGIADGFYGLTAVAAGVTAYFLYRGFRPEPSAPSLALMPVATPQGGALVVAGTF
jgi:tetratricopeptide (TPR) repeat protein